MVISSLTLSVKAKTITTVLGANGAGKTTLLSCIMGLVKQKKGEIYFNQKKISVLKTHKRVISGLSLSPEGRLIFPKFTVEENINAGGFGVDDRNWKKKTKEFIFTLFPRLKDRLSQLAGDLSGGEQQMLAIGRSLMANPLLLLLDEPSLGIAPLLIDEIFQSIIKIKESGLSVLLVEQNAMEALKISDYGYVMDSGNITIKGVANELIHNSRVKEAYLGG